ncbi:DUF6557 family protein [Paenibacillus sp. FSL W8-0194]|uniref:DUF6557 family protein n=1 Tax=Paenibacillus sp. FSL W8-0194 TaxID=2921711 RepID=UPI0030DD32CE
MAHRSFLLLGVLCVKHHFTKGEALFLYPLFPIPTPTEILHYQYLTVYKSLLSKDPAKNVEEMIIHIDKVDSDASLHEDYVEYRVHGKNNSSEWDGYWDISANNWEEWLGFYIDHNVLERFSSEQIAALCLYEMTWFGFSEELNHE